jgi:hypothetical protein
VEQVLGAFEVAGDLIHEDADMGLLVEEPVAGQLSKLVPGGASDATEAREDLGTFLAMLCRPDGKSLNEQIAAALEQGYVIGLGPSHGWVFLEL